MTIKELKWNTPTRYGQKLMTAEILKSTPALYATEGQEEKTVTAHYFIGGYDAYLLELDPESGEAFGYAGFNGEVEPGYFSIPDLAKTCVQGFCVERDIRFKPCNISTILNR